MKKILLIITLLLFLIPTRVNAMGTDKYYVDVTINEDGSATFKEFIIFDGSYNYFERKLVFKGNVEDFIGNTKDDFLGTNIYNASGITNICTSSLSKSLANNFEYTKVTPTCFSKVAYASNGDAKVSVEDITNSYANIRIYNPSTKNEAFYLEYTITDLVVIHEDIAELLYNFEWSEDISDYKVRLNLKNESNEFRIFSHGPANGNNEIINNTEALVTWRPLNTNSITDIRLIFDKSLVPYGKKTTNVTALPKILDIEEEMANKQNEIRRNARILMTIYYVFFGIWVIVLGILIYNFYKKHDKEHKTLFKEKYFRDFPNNYGPEIVGYLFTKNNIKSDYLSASILELIRKKALKLEVDQSNKSSFTISKTNEEITLTSSETLLLNWFINEVGNGEVVTKENIKDASKKDYTSFLASYKSWKDEVIALGNSYNFYEETGFKKFIPILISFLGLIFLITGINLGLNLMPLLALVITIVSFIYLITATKRTKIGAEDYSKWLALKRFMLDFGRMSEKELPEIVLWEKYLVYATVFGIADKVQKAMEMKIKELNLDDTSISSSPYLYGYHFGSLNSIGNTISKSISNAVSTATAASSNSSSSGGFGGGASFGGGGGGFGGGGGRG